MKRFIDYSWEKRNLSFFQILSKDVENFFKVKFEMIDNPNSFIDVC